MIGRVAIGAALMLAPAVAAAQGGIGGPRPWDRRTAPNEAVGLQVRIGSSGLYGEGAGKASQPLLDFMGSLQIRFMDGWYIDLQNLGSRPLVAEAAEGQHLLAIDGTLLGVRMRRPYGEGGTSLTAGLGGGSGRTFIPLTGRSFGGYAGYASVGWERELYGNDQSAGYWGVELMWTEWFFVSGSPFDGGSLSARITLSYYLGGGELDECM